MTILTPLDPSSSSSSSPATPEEGEHPLKVKRAEAIEAQRRLATLNATLQQLQELKKRQSDDAWSTATTLSSAASSDDGEEDEEMPSTPTSGAGIVRINVDAADAVIAAGSSLVDDSARISVDSQTGKRIVEMRVDEAIGLLSRNKSALEERVAQLRDEVVQLARQTLAEHVEKGALPFLPLGDQGEGEEGATGPKTEIDDEGKAVNEDGLPFVDPIEQLGDEEEEGQVRKPAPLVPFVREPREDRRAWMESILGELEEEEELDESEDVAQAKAPLDVDVDEEEDGDEESEDKQARPTLKRKLSSANRPPPTKSVLKRTSPPPPPLPKFGSSGIRKGFLNLNPSSPAAERSSDFVGREFFPDSGSSVASSRMSRSSSLTGSRNEPETLSDRMTRSVELPSAARASFSSPKKQVRIQSPERERHRPERSAAKQSSSRIARATRDVAEDSTEEEEARQLLELMGISAIRGHPQGQEIIQGLAESNRLRKEASKMNVEGQAEASSSKKAAAVGESVVERDPGRQGQSTSSSSSSSSSGFKRGFLNAAPKVTPRKSVNQGALSDVVKERPLPAGPRQSKGMTALDRASQSDEPLEREREQMGLTPSVPHARPSKAYAAKLEERRKAAEGGQSRDQESVVKGQEGEVKEARPGGKVRFGGIEAVSTRDDDEDDDDADANMEETYRRQVIGTEPTDFDSDDDEAGMAEIEAMKEQQLDPEELEALGLGSDLSDDDDDGYDSDDIMALAPSFNADESSFGGNEELKREYLKAKERWSFLTGERQNKGADEEYQEGEGQDLVAADENEDLLDEDGKRVSRFKKERAKRVALGKGAPISNELGSKHRSGAVSSSSSSIEDKDRKADEAGHELAHLLESAQNAGPAAQEGEQGQGPVMVIPSMANVRFPKGGDLVEDESKGMPGKVQLEGESDDDEDRLHEVMRMRLQERDAYRDRKGAMTAGEKNGTTKVTEKPPEVVAAPSPPATKKKESLFKARLKDNAFTH
ncbi:hypothetical protein FA10DRAFT_303880 [Acaromyces ingoldii]|uniref:DUF3835 domain-containing protein n=1 Tax=Acaromyces ingoldii TaxID=215250 RepID=A0A316YI49_9BASI|nr:hypothetical protein FA10DRAFT_303880 [Acaromyces ingoldii]PWN87793.1 hypothetical protein FA10DRAFT_303880 [Acaromyces ingoldii]